MFVCLHSLILGPMYNYTIVLLYYLKLVPFCVEYVNGQRMLYQSSDGYLLGQAKNGSWLMEEPSPYCQPAKVT